MKITLFQDHIVWADKDANLQHVGDRLERLAGKTDLVVLPEMFTTGFCPEHLELAEDMQGKTVRFLKHWASVCTMAISGSFLVCEAGKFYNRAFFVFPDGTVATADKRHLFSPGGEDRTFQRGNDRLIVHYKGFNVCVLVCYDLRFPVWSRNVGNQYDLLLYVANWPVSRMKAWNVLLEARAIENQAYVCGVNRIGEGNGICYSGESKLINAKGEVLLAAAPNQMCVETVDISIENLEKLRKGFPVWKDADMFNLI